MDIALCYENVLPERGGCENYIRMLAHRLARGGHSVHLYACRWDADSLPLTMHYHRVPSPGGPRFLRSRRFDRLCAETRAKHQHDVTIGFDRIGGVDVLYPQGGLHVASADHNLRKHSSRLMRFFARCAKNLDLASWSYSRHEREIYLGSHRPAIAVNSRMVQAHCEQYYDIPANEVAILHAAVDTERFLRDDRLKLRAEERTAWGVGNDEPVGLFVAMNYRLKGLEPLLHSLTHLKTAKPFRLVVIGHPKFQAYQRQAQRLGVADRVVFLGFRRDPTSAYFGADFLVHPTFYDPCSLVVLEALACGLPPITTRYNGASELYNDGQEGFVINDPHDHASLAGAISRLLDPATRSACAAAARQAANRWTFEHHYQQLMELLMQTVGRKQAA